MIDSDDAIREKIVSIIEEFRLFIANMIVSKFSEIGDVDGTTLCLEVNYIEAMKVALKINISALDSVYEKGTVFSTSDQDVKH